MTLQQWWYLVEQRSREHHKESFKSNKNKPVPPNKLLLIAPLLMVLSIGGALYHSNSILPAVSAQVTSPLVFVSPSNVNPLSIGSTFTVQVQVNNMDQFNGWDIQIHTWGDVISPTSLSIAGNDFAVNASSGTAFEIIHCVNGVGTGCTSSDGPGVVHSALGNTAVLTGNGLLFTITYKVATNQPFCPILPQNDLISSPSSGNGVPHTTQGSVYGTVPPVSGAGGGIPPHIE